MLPNTNYTSTGLKRLGRIVQQARLDRDLSYRGFEALIQKTLNELGTPGVVSHNLLRKLELADWQGEGPKLSTLIKISYVLPYTVEDLVAIATESEQEPVSELTAESVLALYQKLSVKERDHLLKMLRTGDEKSSL